jgi:NitT/TauT family transport system substrate-binding protein
MNQFVRFSAMAGAALLSVALVLPASAQGGPAGTPAPKPLAKQETVKISYSAKLEAFAPLFLGMAMGEYAKENIKVEARQVGKASDSLVLLSTGQTDAWIGSPLAGLFNAIAGGSEIKIVAPGMFQQPGNLQGVWVRKEFLNGRKFSPDLLKGETFATMVGLGSSVSLPIALELEKAGLTLNDVKFKQMGASDIVLALESGAVNAGFVSDPLWLKIDRSKVEFAFGQPPTYSTGGVFYGPNLLKQRREVGEAFMRAMVRTVRTYLQGDYHKDAKVMEVLAKELEIPMATLQRGVSLGFPADQPLADSTVEALQKVYLSTPGVLTYDKPLPVDRVLDRGFIQAAMRGTGS